MTSAGGMCSVMNLSFNVNEKVLRGDANTARWL